MTLSGRSGATSTRLSMAASMLRVVNGTSNGRKRYCRRVDHKLALTRETLTSSRGDQAAAFGKSFLESYNPSEYVQVTKNLRILNALREYKVGLPLTIDQYACFYLARLPSTLCAFPDESFARVNLRYNARPLAHLIARLNSRSQHLLALRISTYLGLSPSPVLRHWAQRLIAASAPSSSSSVAGFGTSHALPKTDQDICAQIVDKLSSFALDSRSPATNSATTGRTIGYPSRQEPVATAVPVGTMELSSADIALTAFNLGRTRLALMLVEKEMRSDKKIRMLNRMGEIERALEEADKSGDSDLGPSRFFFLSISSQRFDPLSFAVGSNSLFGPATHVVEPTFRRRVPTLAPVPALDVSLAAVRARL